MTKTDLLELIRNGESSGVEFKKDTIENANTAGGVLVVGVENGTRRVTGVRDVPAVEERLAGLVMDSIRPRVVPEIEIAPWRRTHVLLVEVCPSPARPHYLKRLGPVFGREVRQGRQVPGNE
ncbi:MAG: helix-turn-helix domain-containing protein [Acidobacteriota bacterium]